MMYRASHVHPRQALILLLAEDEEALVLAAWSGLDALAATIPKEDAPSHVTAVKDAVLGAKEKVKWVGDGSGTTPAWQVHPMAA